MLQSQHRVVGTSLYYTYKYLPVQKLKHLHRPSNIIVIAGGGTDNEPSAIRTDIEISAKLFSFLRANQCPPNLLQTIL